MSEQEALHPFIRPVEPGDVGERICFVCGHGFDGDRHTADGIVRGKRFAELRMAGAEAVEGPNVYTRHDEPGATVTMVRSAVTGDPVPVRHEHPIMCDTCIRVAAALVGLSDNRHVERDLREAPRARRQAGGGAGRQGRRAGRAAGRHSH